MRKCAPNRAKTHKSTPYRAKTHMTDGTTQDLHDPLAEERLLASVLVGDATLAQRFVQDYRPDLFESQLHRDLAGATADLISRHTDAKFAGATWLFGFMAELITLVGERGRQIDLDYLKQIRINVSDHLTSPAGVYDLQINRLRDLAGRRELRRALMQLSSGISDTNTAPEDTAAALIERLQAGNTQPQQMQILNMADLVMSEDVAREDLIGGGILPMRGFLLIPGAPKVGKSILAMQIAAAVAAGKPFLRWQTKQANVLILSGEGGAALLKERFQKMAQDTDLSRIFALCPDGGPQILLDDASDRARVILEAKRRQVGLIVVDPLVRFHRKDENATAPMAELMRNLNDIRQATDAAMCICHHTRKPGLTTRAGSGLEARGSSVIAAEYDAAAVLDRYDSGEIRLTLELRWESAPPAFRLELQEQEGLQFHIAGEWTHGNQRYTAENILDAITELGAPTYEELVAKTGASKPTLRDHLQRLMATGRVQETTGERGVKHFSIASATRLLQ